MESITNIATDFISRLIKPETKLVMKAPINLATAPKQESEAHASSETTDEEDIVAADFFANLGSTAILVLILMQTVMQVMMLQA